MAKLSELRRAVWLGLCCLPALAACVAPPESGAVNAAFAPERHGSATGLAAPRTDTVIAGTAFGGAVAQAVETHPAMDVLAAEQEAARANERAAQDVYMPEISIGGEIGLRATASNDIDASPLLTLSQVVYDGGLGRARQAETRARVLESRGARLEEASARVLRAVEAWRALLTQQKLVSVAAANLSEHRRLAAQISERVDSGAGDASQMLRARSRMAGAQATLVNAQADLERAEADFAEIFGAAPEGPVAELPPAPALPSTDTALLISESIRMRKAKAALLAAGAEVAGAEAGMRPKVFAVAGSELNQRNKPDATVGLRVSYDIFPLSLREASLDAARARLKAAKAEQNVLERSIRQALSRALADQRAGGAAVRAARDARNASAATLSALKEQFRIGGSSLTDLLDAQRDYRSAEEGYIRALGDRALADYALLALTGDILDVFGIRLEDDGLAS